MRKKLYGKIEAILLIFMGIWGIWFSLSENYTWLMNEKFKILSLIGFIMLLVIGSLALSNPQKQTRTNSFVFIFSILLLFFGKPLSNQHMEDSEIPSTLQAGLWDEVDQETFPKVDLQDLFSQSGNKVLYNYEGFTTIGMVKRLDKLDERGSIALMTNFMYCCLADLVGVGFRLPCDNPEDFTDGQWIMVSGHLAEETLSYELPNFRFGRAMISSLNEHFFIEADKIMTYDRIDQLPLLSDLIETTESGALFKDALYKSGVIEELKGDKQLTLFIPVDQAIDALEKPINEMSPRELKRFVKRHIVPGRYTSHTIGDYETLKTLNKKKLIVTYENAKITINDSRLLFTDFDGQNGVIHFIYPALTK
jgi:hypothetical protein